MKFLDLSNNQLTAQFPTWTNDLTRLSILNLGQNNISGEIPLFVGGGRNDGGHRLHSLREFIRLLYSDNTKKNLLDLKELFDLKEIKRFYRKHFDYLMNSNDLLWINPQGNGLPSELQEMINKYFKAEESRLLTAAFVAMRWDPVLRINQLELLKNPLIQQSQPSAGRFKDKNSILPTVQSELSAEHFKHKNLLLIAIIAILAAVYDI